MNASTKPRTQTIDVPARGRKWVTGTIVRDGLTLYRVAGKPIHYHPDCLAMQRVTRVRTPSEDWIAVTRLLAIMQQVKTLGQHTPSSRGACGAPPEHVAEYPAVAGETARWEARKDAESYASYPSIEVCGDVLLYVEPIYDDSPIVTWMRDGTLADEARDLIGRNLSLTRYPSVRVRS